MKVLLDEMWSPVIASQLRRRDHDVVAITEPEYSGRYAGIPDDEVFDKAQEDGRTIVTDNISDYERVRADWESRGEPHNGLIYALNPPFDRNRGEAVIGHMVRSLDHFLASDEAQAEPFNRMHYLHLALDR